LTGPFHFVRSLVNRPEPTLARPWTTDQTSFTQLGEIDREIIGLGLTDSYYFFQYPPGATVADGSKLVLHMAFSPALRAQGSYAEVYVNDIYVGAVDGARTGGGAWVSFDLPAQALNELIRDGRARELNVKLAIANLLPANNCEQVNAESSWTKIYADSYFQFDYLPVELPDLYHFPYPFVTPDNETPVRLILPPTPTTEELQTALSLAALMGSQAVTDLHVDMVRSTAVTPEAYAGHHLVLIGTPFNNPALQEVMAGEQTSMPIEVYQVLGTPHVGFFHMLASPWDEEMSVLGIYGEMESGFQAAADTLYEEGRLANESGTIALARAGEPPVVIYREAGLSGPQFVQPDIILSETGQPANAITEPTATAVSTGESATSPTETETASGNRLTNTEQLILIITAFLIVLVTVAALLRIAWRIRA
ncbi:MAG TPA: cellulose biosynthesis cyclic di-GMP-binding regulatory protein BcsB, partial [Chloroflexota bacterium]|nr:cellulose biosynthesis cyclic di-GMP-binding regulatory protein BcsB [Chloroflexota bacterium]